MNNSHSLLKETTIRAVLSCIVCDLPAVRKVCGFLSFNARYGCSKCLKEFIIRFNDKNDYSGYDYVNWPTRDPETHIAKAVAAENADSALSRNSIQSSYYGTRYSELFQLPYYDIIHHHVVDPMHNLFLGIAKHAVHTWRNLGVIKEKELGILQARVDSINPPAGIGRIPRKIGSAFKAFTADEWKHWTLLYSVYALHKVIPDADYDCWCLFVDACRALCQLTISPQKIEEAHLSIVNYCEKFAELYGKEACTPNMHMACHLRSCMLDYGPLAAFWAFSFERYNGTLEGLQKSWNGPEKQMLLKFIGLQAVSMGVNCEVQGDFIGLLQSSQVLKTPSLGGSFSSFSQTSLNSISFVQQSVYYTCPVRSVDATLKEWHVLSQPRREKCWNTEELHNLKN